MSYQPTYEDAVYLLTEEWEAFDNGSYADGNLRSIARSRQDGEPIDEEAVAERVYREYLDGGADPLTESPIPEGKVLAKDPYYEQLLDPNKSALEGTAPTLPQDACDEEPDTAFGATCVDCIQDDGCCLKAGGIKDKEDSTRKIEWPPVDGATTLLVIAHPQKGVTTGRLTANVEVTWEGVENCPNGRSQSPCISAIGLAAGAQQLTTQSEEVTVTYDQPVRLMESLSNFIPYDVTLGFMAFETLIGGRYLTDQGGQATFQPRQCFPSNDTRAILKVIPYPYTELGGDVSIAVETVIMTSEVSARVAVTGTLNGQYGRHTIKWSRSAEASGGEPKQIPRQNDAPGLIGLMVETVQTINRYVSMGSSGSTVEYDRANIGSGVTISKSLSFKPTGFKLKPVSSSPDLELEIGSLESILSLGVTGKIDLFEVIATVMLTPAGANRIQDARARIAAGENVKATIEGYLELSAEGSMSHRLGKGGGASITSYRIPASGEGITPDENEISSSFTGTLKILGKAGLKLHVEGSIFILRARVGARGSIHTSWMWEVQNNAEGIREKRYTFEGVRVSGEAYAEAGFKGADSDGWGGRSEGEYQAVEPEIRGTLSERVEASIDASKLNASSMSSSEEDETSDTETTAMIQPDAQGEEGNGKTIWEGEQGEWVAF